MLDKNINYIVSGLERSGTSVMMQMLYRGDVPIAFDESRPADAHNPKGYYELAGGKIINQLIDGVFDMKAHAGQVIKVTAYGLKFLPEGCYRIVYMRRDIEEVIQSMHKMGGDSIDIKNDKILFEKLDKSSVKIIHSRRDIEYMTVDYHDVIGSPKNVIMKVGRFFDVDFDYDRAVEAVDRRLYRNRVRDS